MSPGDDDGTSRRKQYCPECRMVMGRHLETLGTIWCYLCLCRYELSPTTLAHESQGAVHVEYAEATPKFRHLRG